MFIIMGGKRVFIIVGGKRVYICKLLCAGKESVIVGGKGVFWAQMASVSSLASANACPFRSLFERWCAKMETAWPM